MARRPQIGALNRCHVDVIGANNSFELSLSVFNLFDEDTAIDFNNDALQEDLPLSNEEFFAGFDPNQVVNDNSINRNPLFGLANQFQASRSARIGVSFRFD